MAAISGVSTQSNGTTIDVNSIVSQLMQVEQQPLTRLNQREASYKTQLSAFGSLSSVISSYQSSMSSLADSSKFLSLKATASDSNVFTASASSDANPGTYAISVTNLAHQQKLVAAGKAKTTDVIG